MSKRVDRWLYDFSARLPVRLIQVNGKPYLERYYLGSALGVTFYLHRFVSADREEHVHNHPWGWGRALVLSGGYDEEVATDLCPRASESGCVTVTRRVRWWNRVDGSHFHRIANAERGTWTLFFHGPRTALRSGMAGIWKGWGFLERQGGDTVFRPYPSAGHEWWRTAARGAESGRVVLQ